MTDPQLAPVAPRPKRSRLRRILLWSGIGGLLVILTLTAISAALLRPSSLKARVERGLSARLNLDVTIDEISVSVLPRPRVSGRGLKFRVPDRPDLPPFIDIGAFWMDIGLLTVLRKHVETVHLDDMKIAVPPDKDRAAVFGRSESTPDPEANAEDSGIAASQTGRSRKSTDVVVGHLISHNTELRFIPRKPEDAPLVFAIHELVMSDVGFDNAMPFKATLTNPVPRGLIETEGSFGPWHPDGPNATELSGKYVFTGADLSTIDGIGGKLGSVGEYAGRITAIRASGTTETPDFSLDLGGKPVPLSTTYVAIVDGTSGTTRLESVNARLGDTAIHARGLITNRPGPEGHDINLTFGITDGRIEDVLRLAMDAPKPMLTGDINLTGSLALPHGKGPVRQRLRLAGRFGLEGARFTDGEVQQKLHELSRRSQGINKDDVETMSRVMTNLGGQFALTSGLLRFTSLTFQVPGADVALAGSYQLHSEVIDLRGNLRMKATVSKAMGGIKSIFLKPFDFIFRKDGAGAVVPIKITGTRDEPKMGIEMGRVFGGDGK